MNKKSNHCSNLISDGGISESSDFASRINRSFNAEEKKEIERLRNLCQKEV